MIYTGKVASDRLYQVKFGISGKLSYVNAVVGQMVNRGALLARLDQTEHQTILDRSLRYYELIRAEFDLKQKTNLSEFEKKKIQAELDISVKNTEIAKINLESTNLYSPLNGLIIAVDPALSGMNITPSAFVITIVDPSSYYFETSIPETDLDKVKEGSEVILSLIAFPTQKLPGKLTFISPSANKPGFFNTKIIPLDPSLLRLGLTGKVTFKP